MSIYKGQFPIEFTGGARRGNINVQQIYQGNNIIYNSYPAPPESFIIATGGTITYSGDYKIHTFTSDGTFTVTQVGSPNNDINYLILAGGGGGSGGQAATRYGAGGAGGVVKTGTKSDATATGYSVVRGAGGNGGGINANGSAGGNSSIFGITATGGNGGLSSGTGGSNADYSGGGGFGLSSGAGAGAGGNGETATTHPGNADGGIGVTSTISGTSTAYGGGGGGAEGGLGVDGGGNSSTGAGSAGTTNRGGGGGGSGGGSTGGAGGSGVVITRYKFYNSSSFLPESLSPVAYWDAGRATSYPGSGSSWFDLSGNGYTATANGGPTFVGTAGTATSYFDFDGTDDWFSTTVTGSSTYTLVGISYFDTIGADSADSRILDNDVAGQFGQGYGAGETNEWCAIYDNGFWTTTGLTAATGTWYISSFDSTTSLMRMRVGANPTPGATLSYTQGAVTAGGFVIGRSKANSRFLNGRINAALIFNKVLSDDEWVKLYNYFNARGL